MFWCSSATVAFSQSCTAHRSLISVLANCANKFLGVCTLGNLATTSVATCTSNGVQFIVVDFVDIEVEVNIS